MICLLLRHHIGQLRAVVPILISSFRPLLYSILSWYTTEDLAENIEDTLEDCGLGEEVLPLTSL